MFLNSQNLEEIVLHHPVMKRQKGDTQGPTLLCIAHHVCCVYLSPRDLDI